MTSTVHLEQLRYQPDSTEIFERVKDLPGAALLDSGHPYSERGRFDIITADGIPLPCSTPSPGDDPATALRAFAEIGRFHQDAYGKISAPSEDIPFCGGVLGYLDYGCGQALNHLPPDAGRADKNSLLTYRWAVVQDHLMQRSVLVCLPQISAATRRDLLKRLQRPRIHRPQSFSLREEFRSNLDAAAYRGAFERIQAYIRSGDCYQVNLAQRFTAACSGDPWEAYKVLRTVAGPDFGAYLCRGEQAVLSLSPERFLSLTGRRVETSPIKGTRPRHSDPAADRLAADELRNSEKDRSENLMIVDLLRNDLGRSCSPGSIRVDNLFELQSFPTVHHLVSTISGELSDGRDAWTLLQDSFPGGSITGAPKRRAMEIISELEPDARQVYCGSVIYISADGRMDSNISIRTFLYDRDTLHCWGGGGIVADSQCDREYEECWDKVGRFLRVLEAL